MSAPNALRANRGRSQRSLVARLISSVGADAPFVSPEAIERASGRRFALRLGANESAFGASPHAIEAAIGELSRASCYADPDCYELREAISQATGAHADEILVGGGIDDLMGLAIRCVLGPGDIAAATANTYPMFEYHVRGSGGRLRTVPYGDDMHVDLDRLSEMVHEHAARIVYVANPDNPSGSCRGKDAMERFLTALPESTLLLLDEAYNEFVGQQEERKRVRHRTLRDPANVVRLRTFSKGYGLAGLHVGYLVAPAHYVDAIGKVRTQHGVNRVAQAAAQAALSDVAHLQTVIRMTGKMRAMYADMGRRHRWRPLTSHTNFVTFDVGSATRARWLVETLSGRGVFVRGGQAPPVKGYVRVTIGTDDECRLLDEALTSLPRENARM